MVWYARARLRSLLRRFVGDERGLEMIEIALIAALVVIVSIVIVRKVGVGIQENFQDLCEGIRDQGDCSTK